MSRPFGSAFRQIRAQVLLSIAFFLVAGQSARAGQCPIVQRGPESPADLALLQADYGKAEGLYRAELAQDPQRIEAKIGLVHALLHQEKVQEAAQMVNAAISAQPNTAALVTLRGEVEYRRGTPWAAAHSAAESDKLDPCNPRNMLLIAKIARLSSLYATEQKAVSQAHLLDPNDPDIAREWIYTLPRRQRETQIEDYLAKPEGLDPESLGRLRSYLAHLQKVDAEPNKSCHLVSSATATQIPFTRLMYDPSHIRAFGLEVKLNDHVARLEIDTGAGGMLISRAVAQRAGLKPLSQTKIGGIGDEGEKAGYTAYADSIHIGNLEFKDCLVEVLDARRGIGDADGLIGMDVFSQFLVTLDYPMQKLLLGPLPPRPGENTNPTADLDTEDVSTGEAKNAEQPQPTAESKSSGGVVDVVPEPTVDINKQAETTRKSHGPYDRYIAPEMQGYTPVYRVGHDLILPATLSGKEMKLFIMDTGAWSTSVSPDAAREVTKVHRDNNMEIHGISGKVTDVYRAGSITFRFAHLAQEAHDVAAFDTSGISKNLGLEVSGFIGANTLRLLTIHIDYRDGLVKFDYDPNRGFRF